jgi:hypothetical protein
VLRLHVDRPARVWRGVTGWVWRCSLCPLPLQLIPQRADSWQEAQAAADAHTRHAHPVRQPLDTHGLEVAA